MYIYLASGLFITLILGGIMGLSVVSVLVLVTLATLSTSPLTNSVVKRKNDAKVVLVCVCISPYYRL